MNFKTYLPNIKAFAFDIDGVLSSSCISLDQSGEPLRMVNIKDGYAIQYAVKMGYPIAIITGGNTQAIKVRYEALGVEDIYLGAHTKTTEFEHWIAKYALKPEEVMYMGDDIPDYDVMKRVGLAVCPKDAVAEIKAIAHYVSDKDGGQGCGRDVIEQVLKAQNKWFNDPKAFGW